MARFSLFSDSLLAINREHQGVWLIKAVHRIRRQDPKADWKSYWASLTFELDE